MAGLLARGARTEESAERLLLSHHTVRTHVRKTMTKNDTKPVLG